MFGQLIPCGGGDAIPLLAPKLLVGRRSSCDIKLDFPNVSSHHCELELRNGYWNIRDLNSSNGIKVNGERCETCVLMPGDEIAIAKHAFRVAYMVATDSEAPEEENTFSRSLMEKAGLEVKRPNRNPLPETAGDKRTDPIQKQSRRVASEDDFIMDWLAED